MYELFYLGGTKSQGLIKNEFLHDFKGTHQSIENI